MSKFLIYTPKQAILFPASAELPPEVKYKPVKIRGKDLKVVKHTLANTLTLREQGVEIPSPAEYWDFPLVKNKFDPFKHQVECAAFLTLHKRAHCLLPLGAGKSYTSLAAATYLIQQGVIKKVGILAPLSCLRPVWATEIFESMLQCDLSSVVVHGTSDKRKELLAMDVNFYISNHAFLQVAIAATKDKHGNVIYSVKKGYERILDIDLWIFDESSMLRSLETRMWGSMNFLLQNKNVRYWALTGYPTPNSPVDCYAQQKLLDPTSVPKYFSAFRRTVCYEQKQGLFSKWLPLPGSDVTVFKTMQPSFTVDKAILNLPPLTIVRREVEISSEQKKHYKKMLQEMVTNHADTEITAQNAADKCLKLRQILIGAIKTGDDEYAEIDAENNPRLKTVLEIIDESPAKTLVISPFTGGLRLVNDYVKKHGITCEYIDGSVSEASRGDIMDRFQNTDNPRVLLAQTRAISHGITATRADKIVLLGPICSADAFMQLLSRIWRTGQKLTTTAYLLYSNSLEKRLWDVDENKKQFQDEVINIFLDELKNA